MPQSLLPELSLVGSEPEEPLTQLAMEVEQQQFTTSASLRRSLERRRRALEQDQTRDQYLVFTSVPPAQSARLSDDASRTSKYCRFSFNTESRILIAKITSNPAHQLAIRSFDWLIFREPEAMQADDDMDPLGSSTVTVRNWTREADCCWLASTNPQLSFVVEVGLSESSQHLALAARGWLESRSSSVQLVVTIAINRENPELVLKTIDIPRLFREITQRDKKHGPSDYTRKGHAGTH